MTRTSVREVVARTLVAVGSALMIALLALPLLGLALRISPKNLIERMADPIVLNALRISLVTSLAATALVILLGIPLAYVLATRSFRGRRVLEVLVDLPLVLPPTVAGLALLMALGRNGLAGKGLAVLGVQLPFTILGVVVAQAFMAAPLFISSARGGFQSVDRRLVEVASTLRAPESAVFQRVILPLAAPSLVSGAVLACARALGEFGATVTFAGNLPGRTQTMPLAVYVALQTDLDAAVALSVILLLFSLTLLLVLRAPLRPRGFFRAGR